MINIVSAIGVQYSRCFCEEAIVTYISVPLPFLFAAVFFPQKFTISKMSNYRKTMVKLTRYTLLFDKVIFCNSIMSDFLLTELHTLRTIHGFERRFIGVAEGSAGALHSPG